MFANIFVCLCSHRRISTLVFSVNLVWFVGRARASFVEVRHCSIFALAAYASEITPLHAAASATLSVADSRRRPPILRLTNFFLFLSLFLICSRRRHSSGGAGCKPPSCVARRPLTRTFARSLARLICASGQMTFDGRARSASLLFASARAANSRPSSLRASVECKKKKKNEESTRRRIAKTYE